MKTLLLLLGCVVLATNYQTVSGGLVLDIFGNVKKGVDKVRDDARTVLHIKKKDNKGDGDAETEGNADRTTTTSTTTETCITARAETTTAEATVTAKNTTTDATVTTETTTIALTNGTDDKEGKENFSGACSAGYLRTDDGRCKPSF